MMRRALLFGILLFLSLFVVRVAIWRPAPLMGQPPQDGYTRVAGAIHVHSLYSDGTGTPQEIIEDSRKAGLSFVILTDHNNLDAKRFEGYHDRLLLLVGCEASTYGGHILALGIPDPAFRFSGDPLQTLEDIRDLGGSAFVAHPFSQETALRWQGWSLPGDWGMEVLNEDSQWRAAGRPRLVESLLLYAFNSKYGLLKSQKSFANVLSKWDGALRQRNVPAIAGADAHRRLPVRKNLTLQFPPYRALFELAQNHVVLKSPLTGDANKDGIAIVQSLAAGRNYIAFDAMAPANNFYFVAGDSTNRWTMGETLPPKPAPLLQAGGKLPERARIVLKKDGKIVAEHARNLEFRATGPGVYRIEVWLPMWEVPWIISNPIYVYDTEDRQKRQARTQWPFAATPPETSIVLDSFDQKTTFTPVADSSSTIDSNLIDNGAMRMRFHLGFPSKSHPFVWCALVNTKDRNLSGRIGLTFSIKGDGVYRMWVQVRDQNPNANEEHTEWWFRSVRANKEWLRISIPFSELRSDNPHTDGRLDLDKVKQLVFILDQGAVKPGTKGTIWIDNLGVY